MDCVLCIYIKKNIFVIIKLGCLVVSFDGCLVCILGIYIWGDLIVSWFNLVGSFKGWLVWYCIIEIDFKILVCIYIFDCILWVLSC